MPVKLTLTGIFIMINDIFNPADQEEDFSGKIVVGLERISEAFKVLLWEKAKLFGLSPIQIQILIFISYHKSDFCKVSHLAREFNLTKPTISDAIRVLVKKGLVTKDLSDTDSRSYSIGLSNSGKTVLSETKNFANPIKDQLNGIEQIDLENLFMTLSKLIYKLNQNGILTVQRICYGCQFYNKTGNRDYCSLLNKELLKIEIRLDCPEFKERD